MSIKENLRRAMDENGVSVASLASSINADTSSIRKYLSGSIRPNDAVLARLARSLGCTEEELRYGRPRRTYGRLTTDDVSRATGICPLSLRIGLQRGIWPFGVAYKRPGSSQYTYEYDPAAVIRWVADRKAIAEGITNETRKSVSGPFGGKPCQ